MVYRGTSESGTLKLAKEEQKDDLKINITNQNHEYKLQP